MCASFLYDFWNQKYKHDETVLQHPKQNLRTNYYDIYFRHTYFKEDLKSIFSSEKDDSMCELWDYTFLWRSESCIFELV